MDEQIVEALAVFGDSDPSNYVTDLLVALIHFCDEENLDFENEVTKAKRVIG